MTFSKPSPPRSQAGGVQSERIFKRFTSGQRWEHAVLILSFSVLLLTGLPQKYYASWGHQILATPDSILLARQIHRIAAIILSLEVIYHLAHSIALLAARKLSAAMFPAWRDVQDAFQMVRYLLFLSKEKPVFGKYNFEQKFTYWFLFFGIGIMVVSGLMLWFPAVFTRFLPGGIVPAAKLAHSTEAIVSAIFIVIWHFYHVHIERLNLSIFTGWLNEREMRAFHPREFERLTGDPAAPSTSLAAPGAGEPLEHGEIA